MTNGVRLSLALTALTASLLLGNCADPLDRSNLPTNPQKQPSDTLYRHDTVFVIDTVTNERVDTIITVDTVFDGGSDTIIVVDTVIQVQPDTVIVVDTLIQDNTDTIYITDTIMEPDTVTIVDTVVTEPDTIIVVDTVFESDLDTIIIVDTVIESDHDTVIVVDTIYESIQDTVIVLDTIIVTDTVTVTDTVVVTDDTTQMLCGRIECSQKSIVWLLQNPSGDYRLSFAAYVESDQPPQSLTVKINGSTYDWSTAEASNLIINASLTENSTITICSKKPPARGHGISICLSYTRQ